MTLDSLLPSPSTIDGGRLAGGYPPYLSLSVWQLQKTVRQGSTGERAKEREVLSSVCYLAACSCTEERRNKRTGKRIKGTWSFWHVDVWNARARSRSRLSLHLLPRACVRFWTGRFSPVRCWATYPMGSHSSLFLVFLMTVQSYKLLSLSLSCWPADTIDILPGARVFNTNQTCLWTYTTHTNTLYYFFSPPIFCVLLLLEK
jgi:hypothetical protein